jgi:hypothetical protein
MPESGLTMQQMHNRAAFALWQAAYAMDQFANTSAEAGRYYSDNTRVVAAPPAPAEERALTAVALGGAEQGSLGTRGPAAMVGLNVAAHTNAALEQALTFVFYGDADVAHEAVDALWTRVAAKCSAHAAFNAMISRPEELPPGDEPADYGWIVDTDYVYPRYHKEDPELWCREGDMGPGTPPLPLDTWRELIAGEGMRWRTLSEWPTFGETNADKLMHEGRILFSPPDNEMPYDLPWRALRDVSFPDTCAEVIQYWSDVTGDWETL